MMSPRVFYERIVFIDDPENNTGYVYTTSLLAEKIPEDESIEKKDVIADTVMSVQVY